jgi:hypothetical protein
VAAVPQSTTVVVCNDFSGCMEEKMVAGTLNSLGFPTFWTIRTSREEVANIAVGLWFKIHSSGIEFFDLAGVFIIRRCMPYHLLSFLLSIIVSSLWVLVRVVSSVTLLTAFEAASFFHVGFLVSLGYMVYIHDIRVALAWGEAWFGAAISEFILGIRVLGSVGKEKLIGILNGDYFPVHSFYFAGNISGVVKL